MTKKYIDAEKLIAEVERLCAEHTSKWETDEVAIVLDKLEDFIDSLPQEQSEVDLEKEIDMFFDGWSIDEDLGLVDDEGWSVTVGDIKNVARHFYELGRKGGKV